MDDEFKQPLLCCVRLASWPNTFEIWQRRFLAYGSTKIRHSPFQEFQLVSSKDMKAWVEQCSYVGRAVFICWCQNVELLPVLFMMCQPDVSQRMRRTTNQQPRTAISARCGGQSGILVLHVGLSWSLLNVGCSWVVVGHVVNATCEKQHGERQMMDGSKRFILYLCIRILKYIHTCTHAYRLQ